MCVCVFKGQPEGWGHPYSDPRLWAHKPLVSPSYPIRQAGSGAPES